MSNVEVNYARKNLRREECMATTYFLATQFGRMILMNLYAVVQNNSFKKYIAMVIVKLSRVEGLEEEFVCWSLIF